MSVRLYFFGLLAVLFALLFSTAGVVWAIDPLQVFRKANFYEPLVLSDERTQNAGLIRNYEAESLILGSSLTQSCRSDSFSNILGGSFLRISAAGLTAKEWQYFLETRIAHHKPLRVYDIQYWYTFGRSNAAGFREEYGEFPTHLYRPNWFDIARYLINYDNIRLSRNIIEEMVYGRTVDRISFIQRNSPAINPSRKKGVEFVRKLSKQIATGPKPSSKFVKAERHRMLATFEKYYRPTIAANSDIEFNIVIPPFTIPYYQAFEAAGVYRLNTILLFREKLTELKRDYPNVILHDFAATEMLIQDYDNYYDTHHFSETICTQLAVLMAAHPEGAVPAQIKSNTRRIKDLINLTNIQ